MPGAPETKKALIVVRTYPAPAKKGVEVSCTAAITDDGKWLRLFPVPYRFLPQDQRFRKYQWIEVSVVKPNTDQRPESYKIKPDSIRILSDPLPTDREWQARKDRVFPLLSPSLCHLQRERDRNGHPTLGIFKPKVIERLIIEADSATWEPGQLAALRQGHLFEQGPQQELEKIPHSFRYQFRCDDRDCQGHKIKCVDWEMSESWRDWKREYGDRWEEKFRERYETEMIQKYDTYFYVGTVHQHPATWIIVGLFYPPKSKQASLF
ncbi:MAG: hypothetical protein HY645_15635 [Acidobacteria bacterium]|nr:hypothetical protein [Acidobacteriota bacterium]